MATDHRPLLFSGSSHPKLAQKVANELNIPLSQIALGRFPDGEISVQLLESVRGQDVFVLQSVARDPNLYLVELLIMIDAMKRASAKSVVVVLSYFGYCRQDRKDKPRVPITAKLVANLLIEAGASRILTIDLHAGQLQGFFDIPVDHVHGGKALIDKFIELRPKTKDLIVVAPDVGSIKIAREFAFQLGVDLAVVNKHRSSATKVDEVTLIGEVKGKDVLLADDMCSTGETLLSAAKACQEKGAHEVFAAVTHWIGADHALDKLSKGPFKAVLATDTIPFTEEAEKSSLLVPVSVAPLLAHAVRCIASDSSLGSF